MRLIPRYPVVYLTDEEQLELIDAEDQEVGLLLTLEDLPRLKDQEVLDAIATGMKILVFEGEERQRKREEEQKAQELAKSVPWVRREPVGLRLRIWNRDHHSCRYCRQPVDRYSFHVDHVMPKSRGGSDREENLVCACKDCNGKKGSKTPKEAGMKLVLF